MARGYDQHQQRRLAVTGLGRVLGRRSRSKCELCGERTSLEVVEVPPLPEEPDEDHAVMVCGRCRAAVEGDKLRGSPDEWRFLAESVWAEVPVVQVVAVRAARRLAEQGVDWARDTVDGLYLDDQVEAWVQGG